MTLSHELVKQFQAVTAVADAQRHRRQLVLGICKQLIILPEPALMEFAVILFHAEHAHQDAAATGNATREDRPRFLHVRELYLAHMVILTARIQVDRLNALAADA